MASFGTGVTSDDPGGIIIGEAASTILAGDAVFKSGTTGNWAKAQSDATATLGQVGIRGDMGVALGGALVGQRCEILIRGFLENCTALLPGAVYCVSDTVAGEVVASAALTEDTDYLCVMGATVLATTAWINPINTNVVVNLL